VNATTIPASVKTLVDEVYGARWGDAYVEWGLFDAQGFNRKGSGRAASVAPPEDMAVFWSAGLLRPGCERANDNVEKLMVFLIDDVGRAGNSRFDPAELEMFMPAPTVVIESSPGNFQWQWGIRDGMGEDLATALRRSLPWQSHATAMSNLIRLPMGVSGKPGVAHRVRETARGPTYLADEFVAKCGGLRVEVTPKKLVVEGLRAPGGIAAVAAMLRLLPNDGVAAYCDSEPAWFNFCQALWGATGGGPEGLRLWKEWCGAQPQKRDVERVWDRQDPVSSGWGTLVMYADKWGVGDRGGLAAAVFDDGVDVAAMGGPSGPVKQRRDAIMPVTITDPSKMERRAWVYGNRLIRGYMSSTIGAGGTGKSSLTMVEAAAMASGKNLLGHDVREPLRVLIWNGEDPQEELTRRFHAIMKHYKLTQADIGDRVFLVSGLRYPLAIGSPREGKEDAEWLLSVIVDEKIDVVIVDPFVSSHRVNENDNMAIDGVAKTWSRIAKEGCCAVDLVHHVRKPTTGIKAADLSVDDARGASAMVNASRNARVLSTMPESVSVKLQVANRREYFAIQKDAVKANMTPGLVGVDWFHIIGVDLGNGDPFPADGRGPIPGDNVGVVEKWVPNVSVSEEVGNIAKAQNEIAKGAFRKNEQAHPWVGIPIAEALGLELKKDVDRAFVRNIIKAWIKKGYLKIAKKKDGTRHEVEYVEVDNSPDDDLF
jgi:hypothetical protein